MAEPAIDISPKSINFEYILCDQITDRTLHVKNAGDEPLSISTIRPSCDCIETEISNTLLKPGERANIYLKLNSEQKQVDGKFTKYIYIQSNDPKKPVSRIELKGTALRNPMPDGRIEIALFYSEGCKGCDEIRNNVLYRLKREYPGKLIMNEYEISNMDNYAKLMDLEKQHNISKNVSMTLFIANTYLLGKEEIEKDIGKIISLSLKLPRKTITAFKTPTKEKDLKENNEKIINRFQSFSVLTVLGAGLADGINPCAFATIVFLVSFLSIAGRTKREILIITLSFAIAVFLTYFLLGLGLFKVFTVNPFFKSLSTTIYYMAAFFAFIFGVVNLYDGLSYLRYRDPQAVKNKLPRILIEKIHTVIRHKLNTKSLVFSALITGFLVSLLESVCTGQVYLPTIVFITKEPTLRLQAYLYLIFYNLMFIIPLVMVAILCYIGSYSEKIKRFNNWSVFISKILLAIIFFGLTLMLVLS